jgi:hypothetical protein
LDSTFRPKNGPYPREAFDRNQKLFTEKWRAV